MAEETTIEQTPPVDVPYVDRVYSALKDNLSGFNKTPEQFKASMQDSAYASKAYAALKDNLQGFNKSQDEFYSQVGIKKKAPSSNGVDLSGNGLLPPQPNSQSVDLAPVLPQAKQEVAHQQMQDLAVQQGKEKRISDNLKAQQSALDPEHRAAFGKAMEMAQPPAEIRQSTDKELQDYYWSQNPVGKVLNSINYLSSKATKGTLQIAKGAAYLADMASNPVSQATGNVNPAIDEAFKKADENTTFGLTKGDEQRMADSPVMSNLGGLAEFVPAIAGAGATGGGTFYLQGLGQGKEAIDNAEKNGAKVNPLTKNAFILGTGLVNGALMGELGGSLFKTLPAGLRGDITASITANAIKEASGKELTGDAFKQLLDKGATEFGDRLKRGGIATLEGYKHAVTNLGALTTANFALKKGVDATNEQPVFNENLGDLASGLNDVATKQAPFFALPAAIGAATKLTPYSDYKNTVVENLMHDSSPENVERTKQDIADYAHQNGWRTEELEGTLGHVDKIAEIAKSLPKNLPEKKLVDAVDLVTNRKELEAELSKEQEGRKQLDPAVQDIINPNEQLLTDKIEQANDKLKDLVTGAKTTYSKGVGEEEGKFFKNVDGGKPEEITESRYQLETTERPTPNEQAKPNTEIPVEQPADETGVVSKAADQNDETVVDNKIVPNEKVEETPKATEPNTPPEVKGEVSVDEKPKITVNEVMDKPVIYHGEPADIIKDGQTLVAKIKGSNREYELGNIDEVGGKSIKDLGIEHENSVVSSHDNGNIVVRGKEYVNNYSDPKAAINYDKDGNVTSVNLETLDGAKRAFKGDVAEDIAYQIHLKELNKDNGTNKQFEDFFDQNEPAKTAVVARENEVASEKSSIADNEPVSRKPAKEKPKVISEGKPNIEPVKETRVETPKTVVENKSPASPEQEAVSPSVADEGASIKAGDPLRHFADKVRQGKINKLGGFRASTGFDAVWDTSLEVVAKAAEGGAKIADAIEAGLKHIRSTDWYKKLDNKDEFDKQYKEHLSNEYAEVEKAMPAKNEANEAIADELGLKLDESTKGRRTNEVIEKEASDAIKKGYDTPKLVDDILNEGHTATDTEVAILAKYRDLKYDEIKAQNERLSEGGATMSKKQFEALTKDNEASLNEMQDIVQAIRKTGSISGSALRARQLDLQKEYSLASMITKKRQANGGEKLTPEQLSEVTKTVSELEATQKALEARLKKVEEQNAKLKAEQVIKRSPAKRRAATKAELASERSTIYDSIRDEFKKIRQSGQAMSDIPYRRELAAVAKHMPALLRNLAQEGVVRIEDVVDNIYNALKGDLEDITKKDVTDLIAGKYDEVKPTRSALQDNIRALRTQAKLLSQIDDLEKGIKTEKNPKAVQKKNAEVEALKERLKQLNLESQPEGEDKSLSALKKRIQANIDKISKRIADGDYAKEEPKKPVAMDAEALTLRRKYDKIKNEFDIQVAKDALKQRSKLEKLKDDLLNIASLPRALKASLDFSAVLRQGLFSSVGHPKEALNAFKEMFRQTFSEEKYQNWISDLKHSEYYDLMKNSDLYLSDKNDPKIIAREEEFTSNLADKIPGIGKAIAASERAYTGYLNVLRAGVFESQAKELIKRGYTFENSPEVFKGMAKVVNVLTGRGDVPEFLGGQTPKVLSNVLFSPRFMAARIQTLYLWADPRLPKEAKIMAAKDIGATLGAGVTLLSLAALAGYKVNFDPRSTNFLKIQDENDSGSTFYDILGGLPQYVRLLSQIGTGKTISGNGNETDLDAPRGTDNPWGTTRGDIELRFLRGKLSPVIGSAINLQEGRDVVGNPYNFWPQVPLEFVPLPFSDVQEAYQVGGIKNALKVLVPSQFGIGVSSYQPK